MKTTEVNNSLLGKKVTGILNSIEVIGIITNVYEDKHPNGFIGVEIKLDIPVIQGANIYKKYISMTHKQNECGNLQYTKLI